jgi:hypothetical protein
VIELASSLGVQKVGFSAVPREGGEGLINSMLKSADLEDLYAKIFSLSTPACKIVTGDPVASQMKMQALMIAMKGCRRGLCRGFQD